MGMNETSNYTLQFVQKRCTVIFLATLVIFTWQRINQFKKVSFQVICVVLCTNVLFIFFSECEVYSKNHAAPFSKVITFHKKEPFDLEAFYSSPHELPYPYTRIGAYYSIS